MIKRINPPEFPVVEKRCENPNPRPDYAPKDLSMRITRVGDDGLRATFSTLCLAKVWLTDIHMCAHQKHLESFVTLLCKRNLCGKEAIKDVKVTHTPSSKPVIRWMTDPDKDGVRRGCYDLSQYDGLTHVEWTLRLTKGRHLVVV